MSRKSKGTSSKGKGLDLVVLRENATRTLSGFTSGQKTMLAIAGIAVVLGATLMTRLSSSTDWATLYGNLPASDAASVTQALSAQGVSYRLGAGGSAIEVPRKNLYQARLDLSAKNLPSEGSPGYALLDKQGITASEFRQRIDYQRALEGELSRTVRAIDGIDLASVHLVVPKEDLFTQDARMPSASVLVSTRGSRRLTSGQVRSIVHLVASSVEGLNAAQVTVADSAGRMLSAPGEDGSAAGGDSRADQTRAFEDGLARSLQDMVEQVTGVGHASVRVSASLDFDKRSVVTEKFDDNGGKPIASSEKQANETFTGPGAATLGASASGGLAAVNGVGAAPAPASTTTVPGAPASASQGNDYKKTDTQREFSVGKVTEKLDAAPGAIKKLSIAVLVDQRRKISPAALQALVSAAAGLDKTRGDTLQISGLNFDRSEEQLAKLDIQRISAADSKTQMFGMIRGGVLAFLALLTVALGYRSAKKSSVRRESIALPRTGGGSLPGEQGLASVALGSGVEGGAPALRRGREPEGDIDDLILRQPDDVAETLRDWLADRRT